MFDPQETPRVFAVPLGVDFPSALVKGVIERYQDQPPEALARVQLIVNTTRMARRIRHLFDAGPARLLPRISLVTDFGSFRGLAHLPDPVSPLRRRLELVQLIATLLDQQPDLAPRASLYDLADSLADLMDEMHGEGVSPDVIEALDVSDQSGHWERTRTFMSIVRHFFDNAHEAPDAATRQRHAIEQTTAFWEATPPKDPVIVAGSTGSRGATNLLMKAVARLPQGAVILPGFDTAMPNDVWSGLEDALGGQDHPQYRFYRFLTDLGLHPNSIKSWFTIPQENPERIALLSLALRPAPVTDQWLSDGPKLKNIEKATQGITLVEAPSQRIEAQAIAMRLRQAAEDGITAALITPNRSLTRQVTAALGRWGIIPDDSAGMPLQLSPPGRFLRHVGDLFSSKLSAETLLTLLKHPLTHSGSDRGPHLLMTSALELELRKNGPPYPDRASLHCWAQSRKDPLIQGWIEWVCDCFVDKEWHSEAHLADRVQTHIALAERISAGHQGVSGTIWTETAGLEAQKIIRELEYEAPNGGFISARDYSDLFASVLARGEVRDRDAPHPGILIWGTLEARVQGADLLILAGLNEGSWPETPRHDAWLNRALRHRAGLLLPEREVGLAAHDFEQAATCNDVWMTRSIRSDDAETVASRWLNRLVNLLNGLPNQGGDIALKSMRDRGQLWLSKVDQLEHFDPVPAEPRPAPCPPVHVRPTQLWVTEIKTLIRDPYAIYAKHVLGLRPLDPLMRAPDALLRGIVLHSVLEKFVRQSVDDPLTLTTEALLQLAKAELDQDVPWAEARALWLARLERVADWFVSSELSRQSVANPARHEVVGSARLQNPPFALHAKADRIDVDERGYLHIYDYKTGQVPSKPQQIHFDKQLLLEAAIAHQGGFEGMVAGQVERAVYIGLTKGGEQVEAPLGDYPPERTWSEFRELISRYSDPAKGYPSRRSLFLKKDPGNYDQLARFGEWDSTAEPVIVEVGQ